LIFRKNFFREFVKKTKRKLKLLMISLFEKTKIKLTKIIAFVIQTNYVQFYVFMEIHFKNETIQFDHSNFNQALTKGNSKR